MSMHTLDELLDPRTPNPRPVLSGGGSALSLLAQSFEVITEAAGSMGKLRELVLELAMRGQLSERRAGEELPGFLREAKAAADDALGPFDVPAGWSWVSLGRLARLDMGKTPPTKDSAMWADDRHGFPWVSIADMVHFGTVNVTARRVSAQARVEVFRERVVPKGTLLMSFKLTIGKVAILGCDAFHNEAIVSIYPHAPDMRSYLFRVLPLLSRLGASKAAVKGSTLNRESLHALLVPVPPTAEQKRIVAKVDELMSLCDELEARQNKKREVGTRLCKSALEALTTAERPEEFDVAWKRVEENFDVLIDRSEKIGQLRKAALELAVRGRLGIADSAGTSDSLLRAAEIVRSSGNADVGGQLSSVPAPEGSLFALPKDWRWVLVEDLFEVAGGIQKTPHRAPLTNHYPYLRVENVQRGRLDLSRIERFELQPGELEKKRLAPGDILVVEGNGSETEIGRCALWDGSIKDCVHQNHLIRCRPREGTWSPFVLLFLNSPSGMSEMKQLAITTSGLYSLSVGKIRGIWVPVPPLNEQKRIVDCVEQLMKVCDNLEAIQRKAEQKASKLVVSVVAELTG